MRASLDTNVIIHLYRAGQQEMLFQFFSDGVFIYEQIRKVELENHGMDFLEKIDKDIANGKMRMYTNDQLRELGVFKLFLGYVKDNKLLYNPGDMGEVYAISLAQTLGAYSLVTDDTKQGGPYMSLLQFPDNEIMPFTYVDVIILRYLNDDIDARSAVACFNRINESSELGWSLKNHLGKFIKRFWSDPYQETERKWMKDFCVKKHIKAKGKLQELKKLL